MHNSKSRKNPTLVRIKIPANKKALLRDELRRMNINQFSIYNDLDHLSKEIRRNWGLG